MKYKIIVDKQSRTNPSNMKKEYVIDIEELRFKGDVYDSIVITPTEAYVTRRLSLNEYQVLSVLKKSIKEPLGDLNIELFEGENYIYLFDMEGNKFYAEYLLKGNMTDMFVTTKEMTSTINQTAQSIELSVNYKFMDYSTTEEMNSAINMKANEIQSTVSETYSTKNETSQAKQEAIDSANTFTDNKLKDYSTKVEMNSAITQKANEITSTVSETYITKKDSNTNIANAKQEAIDGANSSTDDKLKNYSTTSQMNSAITQKANEITSTVSTNYSTKAETQTAKEEAIDNANNSTDNKLKNYSTTEQMESAINQKADSITSSVSKTYSTKTEMEIAKNEAINSANNTTNNKLKNYSTTEQMNSSITQKANEITQTVESTYETKTNVDTKINSAKSEIKQTTDSISLELEGKVDEEKFTGANILLTINNDSSSATINADKISLNGAISANGNFKIDTEGNMECNNGKFNGGTIELNSNATSYKNASFRINSSDGSKGFMSSRSISLSESSSSGIPAQLDISIYNGENPRISLIGNNMSSTTDVTSDGITTPTVTQTSLESEKKNFEKLNNGLDIIKDIDIYKYNLKNEEDATKKHIGFIIGDNYNYSKEVTSNNNDGVDIYSFVAVCCKAIQEQQEQIESQNNLIQSLIERIEKLEAK